MGPTSTIEAMDHFRVLEFDLHRALLRDLIALFAEMSPAELNAESVAHLEDGQGVYQLFYQNELVYIGKTDLDAGLRLRLLRHSGKIRSRLNLNPSDVSFKAVQIYVFTAMDLESALIKHYKETVGAPAWNLSGFGSNDPGRERDSSRLKDGHFDSRYPIDLELLIDTDFGQSPSAASILQHLKRVLPYLVRFQSARGGSRRPHPDLLGTPVQLSGESQSVRSILTRLAAALAPDWQVTELPGYVIVYKERTTYSHGRVIGASDIHD